jgi:hypothetical protein
MCQDFATAVGNWDAKTRDLQAEYDAQTAGGEVFGQPFWRRENLITDGS